MVDTAADLMTDESVIYKVVGQEYASHKRVKHALGQYVKYTMDGEQVTTNRIEGFGQASSVSFTARTTASVGSTCTATSLRLSSSTTTAS
jgi:hypothetical protein